MSDKDNKNFKNSETNEAAQEQMALDDARRVKVMSPGMMVFKRFVRNKLAIAGFIIIVFMFLFSFIGPFFSPYKIAEQFRRTDIEWADYATGKFNEDPRYFTAEGVEFNASARTAMLLAISNTYKKSRTMADGDVLEFESGGTNYILTVADADPKTPTYFISQARTVASTGVMGEVKDVETEYDSPLTKVCI